MTLLFFRSILRDRKGNFYFEMKRKTNNSRPLKSSESIAEKIDMNPRQVITKTEKIDELKAEVQALRFEKVKKSRDEKE